MKMKKSHNIPLTCVLTRHQGYKVRHDKCPIMSAKDRSLWIWWLVYALHCSFFPWVYYSDYLWWVWEQNEKIRDYFCCYSATIDPVYFFVWFKIFEVRRVYILIYFNSFISFNGCTMRKTTLKSTICVWV